MASTDKLKRMCADADTFGNRELDARLGDLAALVAAALKTRRWIDIPIKTQNHLRDAQDAVRSAAELVDAADYVNEKLLSAANGLVIDLRLSKDLRAVQDDIYGLFEEKAAPRRGFVYIAWRGRPERYVYVGKAGGVARLNLAQHGKLARATVDATSLSLLFPTQSRDEILLGLEASVIRLIENATGQLPEWNDQRGTVPPGPASNELQVLAHFLGGISDELRPYD